MLVARWFGHAAVRAARARGSAALATTLGVTAMCRLSPGSPQRPPARLLHGRAPPQLSVHVEGRLAGSPCQPRHCRSLVTASNANADEARYTKGLRARADEASAPAVDVSPSAHKFDRVALFGAGVLGKAMIDRLVKSRPSDGSCYVGDKGCAVYDVSKQRVDQITALSSKCFAADSAKSAVEGVNLLILAIKPQNIQRVFEEIGGSISPNTVVLSVVAGTTVKTLTEGLRTPKVIRTMPNTPVSIGQGVVVWTASAAVQPNEIEAVESMLAELGDHVCVQDEQFIDMATAISGSGPAYVYMAMESMVDAGVHLGFPRDIAVKLVQGTFQGTAANAKMNRKHLAEMRNEITSPGGTTAAALYVLERGNLRTTLTDAVFAAHEQSVKLGKKSVTAKLPDAMGSGLDDESG